MAELSMLLSRDTRAEQEKAQSARELLDCFLRICEGENWRIEIVPGPRLWLDLMESHGFWANPCFNPDKSDVDESNTMSITIHDADGKFVATNVMRIFETENFNEIMASGVVFHGLGCPLRRPIPLVLPRTHPNLSGLIGYSGGTVISHSKRGLRLGLMTTRIVRCLAEISVKADWHSCHILHNRPGEMAAHPYHFARADKCFPELKLPDRQEPLPVWLLDITREEFLTQAARNVSDLIEKGQQNVGDLALLTP
jgi:hypothetical protein